MITERDYQNILATAREQGHDAGFAEGREAGRAAGLAEGEARGIERGRAEGRSAGLVEGEVRGKLAIARKLLASGMPESQVAEFTGLTTEQLEELK